MFNALNKVLCLASAVDCTDRVIVINKIVFAGMHLQYVIAFYVFNTHFKSSTSMMQNGNIFCTK